MNRSKLSVAFPLIMIALGVGWLLTTWKVLPGVDWAWVLGLGVLGLLTLMSGLDKLTIVIGPMLMVCTIFALLRQTGRVGVDVEIPSLVISLGVLLLIARVAPVPPPRWLTGS